MKKRTSDKEIGALCTMLIEDFLGKFHYSNTRIIDIVSFVTRYLGAKITYEKFAEKNRGVCGFISDGKTPLFIERDGIRQGVIFPVNVIVINKLLTDPDEQAKLRFTIAHEAAHLIMRKHIPGGYKAAFHTEFLADENYSKEMFKEMMNITESMTNRAAATLLIPDFIMDRALTTYNEGNKVTIYVGSDMVIPDTSKRIIKRMADSMGVSFSTCYYRLKELCLLEKRPFSEYAANFTNMEEGYV